MKGLTSSLNQNGMSSYSCVSFSADYINGKIHLNFETISINRPIQMKRLLISLYKYTSREDKAYLFISLALPFVTFIEIISKPSQNKYIFHLIIFCIGTSVCFFMIFTIVKSAIKKMKQDLEN